MRIAIDARKLRDFGIGTYIRNILMELSRLDRATEYVVLCRPDDLDTGDVLGTNFRMVPEPAPPYSVSEQFRIPLALERERVQLLHEPHYVLPPLVRCRSVVTIHDCIHLRFPQYLPNRLGYLYARTSMSLATHRSARVLTVSEASKRDILEYFDVPESKIAVIYNAIEDIENSLKGMLKPEFEEVQSGVAEIREVFRSSKFGNIAGVIVRSGTITRNAKARVIRDGVVVGDNLTIESLRRFKDDVTEVRTDFEAGIGLGKYNDIQVGDEIETIEMREKPRV